MQNEQNEMRPDAETEDAADAAAAADLPEADAGRGAGAGPELQRQLEQQRDQYLRLAAEFDNYRKRTARERAEIGPRAQAELVRHLLEPLDDLMRFADLDPAQVDSRMVIEGVNMVEKKVFKVLAAHGITLLDPAGEVFDPNHHEAVTTEPAASADEDHVVSRVFQVGYLANGQLIRPARVVVKQWNG